MTYYIVDTIEHDVIEYGFATEEEAEKYIWSHPYLKEYWHHYEVCGWSDKIAYGLTWTRDSTETGGTTFLIFHTWDDAIAYACDHPFGLIEDFDFENDIYQIDMTKGK